jgi:nitroreductase
MDFSKLMEKRCSVREFEEKKVDVNALRRIIEAAMRAPSAGNLQSYTIHIVRGAEARQGLAIASDQEFLSQSPVVLVFCADMNRAESKYGERGSGLYAIQDATIACASAQLAAADEGLGSVWVGGFEPLEVARLVGAQAYEIPVAMLPIGHPAEKPQKRGRRPVEEIVREI